MVVVWLIFVKILISLTYFEGSRVPGAFWEDEQAAEKWRWEGVGGGKPSPLGLVWRFL